MARGDEEPWTQLADPHSEDPAPSAQALLRDVGHVRHGLRRRGDRGTAHAGVEAEAAGGVLVFRARDGRVPQPGCGR